MLKLIVMLFPLYSFGSSYVCSGDLPGVDNIFNFVNNLQAVTRCDPLPVGGVKVVNSTNERGSENTMQTHLFGDETFMVPASSMYLIRRPAEDQYEMVFNVNFNEFDPSSLTAADTSLYNLGSYTEEQLRTAQSMSASAEQMRTRLNNCMREASQYMRGPNGEQLTISIVDPSMVARDRPEASNREQRSARRNYDNLTPPPIDIDILPPSNFRRADGTTFIDRVRADYFATDSPCSTLVHEMLHWGGLCDEYTETIPPGTPAESVPPAGCRLPSNLDLRTLGRSDSFMADYIQTVYNARVGNIQDCRYNSGSSNTTVANDGVNLSQFVANNSSNASRMQVLMRRNYGDIYVETLRLGISGDNRNAKDLFCTQQSQTAYTEEIDPNGALTTLNSRTNNSVNFSYLDYVYALNATTTNVYNTTMNCNCAGRGDDTAACLRFLEILNFEIDSMADPNARIYECPFGSSRVPSEDYSRTPGGIKVSDDRISFRSKPIESDDSLLYPAHFLRLVNGECEALPGGSEANRTLLRNYNACARFSTTFSMETLRSNGRRRNNPTSKTCNDRPPACYNADQWLGTRE